MRALDDVRIRTRLVAIFLLPILTLTIVAASQIQSSAAAGSRVDKAVGTDWDQASESVHKAEQRGFVRQVAAIREKLGQLSARRQAIDQLPLSPGEVLPYYTQLVKDILGLNTDIAAAGLTAAVYRSATAYVAMSQAKEAVSYQRGFGARSE